MAKQGSFFRLTITVVVALVVIVYALFNSRFLIKGPVLEVFNIKSGQQIEEDIIEISGKAEDIAFITLNDRPIFIDENKMFKEKVLLTNKVNNIKIYAEDKFGKNRTEELILIKKSS